MSVGRITSLRQDDKGRLEAIQLDSALLGNSGGPVLDRMGRVLGVVSSGIRGAAINFAIPVSHVVEFLRSPSIVFEPPVLGLMDRNRPVNWDVRLIVVGKPDPKIKVKVILGKDSPRTYDAFPTAEGIYRAKAVPVPPAPWPSGGQVALEATIGAEKVKGTVKDFPLKVGRESVRLGELREIRTAPPPKATRIDGRTLTGPITGLGAVDLERAGHAPPD